MWPSSENSGINNKYFTGHQWRRPKSMKQIWIKCFLLVTKSYFFSKLNIAGARNLYISWWHIQACCKEVGNFCHFIDFSNCDLEILCVGWVTHVECRVSQSNDCIVSPLLVSQLFIVLWPAVMVLDFKFQSLACEDSCSGNKCILPRNSLRLRSLCILTEFLSIFRRDFTFSDHRTLN